MSNVGLTSPAGVHIGRKDMVRANLLVTLSRYERHGETIVPNQSPDEMEAGMFMFSFVTEDFNPPTQAEIDREIAHGVDLMIAGIKPLMPTIGILVRIAITSPHRTPPKLGQWFARLESIVAVQA